MCFKRTLIEFCTRDLTTSTEPDGRTRKQRKRKESVPLLRCERYRDKELSASKQVCGKERWGKKWKEEGFGGLTRRVERGTDKATDRTRDKVVAELGSLALYVAIPKVKAKQRTRESVAKSGGDLADAMMGSPSPIGCSLARSLERTRTSLLPGGIHQEMEGEGRGNAPSLSGGVRGLGRCNQSSHRSSSRACARCLKKRISSVAAR
jgi:hypothetical protein